MCTGMDQCQQKYFPFGALMTSHKKVEAVGLFEALEMKVLKSSNVQGFPLFQPSGLLLFAPTFRPSWP